MERGGERGIYAEGLRTARIHNIRRGNKSHHSLPLFLLHLPTFAWRTGGIVEARRWIKKRRGSNNADLRYRVISRNVLRPRIFLSDPSLSFLYIHARGLSVHDTINEIKSRWFSKENLLFPLEFWWNGSFCSSALSNIFKSAVWISSRKCTRFTPCHSRCTKADQTDDERVNERSKASGISPGFIKHFLCARGCRIKGQPACCRGRLKGRTIVSSTVTLSLERDPPCLNYSSTIPFIETRGSSVSSHLNAPRGRGTPLKESQLFHFGDRLDRLATDDTPFRSCRLCDCIPHEWPRRGILFFLKSLEQLFRDRFFCFFFLFFCFLCRIVFFFVLSLCASCNNKSVVAICVVVFERFYKKSEETTN